MSVASSIGFFFGNIIVHFYFSKQVDCLSKLEPEMVRLYIKNTADDFSWMPEEKKYSSNHSLYFHFQEDSLNRLLMLLIKTSRGTRFFARKIDFVCIALI